MFTYNNGCSIGDDVLNITEYDRYLISIIKDSIVENVFLYNLDIRAVYYNRGELCKVSCFIAPDWFKGGVMIHNHPVFKWIEEGLEFTAGASIDDLRLAQDNEVKKLILVENFGDYSNILEYKINND